MVMEICDAIGVRYFLLFLLLAFLRIIQFQARLFPYRRSIESCPSSSIDNNIHISHHIPSARHTPKSPGILRIQVVSTTESHPYLHLTPHTNSTLYGFGRNGYIQIDDLSLLVLHFDGCLGGWLRLTTVRGFALAD